MKKRILAVLLAALLLAGSFLMTACGPKEKPAENNPCATVKAAETTTYPTLGEAIAYVRTLKENGYTEPVTVTLAGGDYFEEEPILLDAVMSNLTIESDPENSARVIGGYRVDGFEQDEFNGVACLSAPVRDGDFSDFIVNGERASLTRYPEEGLLYMQDVENHEGELGSGSRWFIAAEGDIKDFRNFDRVQISFLHYWIDEHTKIESYDPETCRVTMTYPSNFNALEPDPGLGYYLENVAETFGRPDDWYYEDGRVYYVPRDESITPDTIEAYVPTAAKFLDITGTPEEPVTGITLRGLRFAVSRGEYENGSTASDAQAVSGADGTISFNYASDCVVEDCRLTNYGLHGININYGCHGIRVSRCDFWDGGAGGVKMIGNRHADSPDITDHITVEDCSITHCGRRHMSATGILMIYVGQSVIQHNEIADMFYTGISCGWGWFYDENPAHDNLITKNHIHDIGGPLSDMGGIYMLSPQPGTVVSYNLIHGVTCSSYGANGLYCDYGTSDVLMENNIVYDVSSNAFQTSYGANNTVRNNIFYNSGKESVNIFAYEDHVSAILENNIICTNGNPVYELKREHLSHKTIKTNHNLLWEISDGELMSVTLSGGDKIWTPDETNRFFGIDTDSVIADPGFADPANHDFTLGADSPAVAMGFEPIDMSDVGPRR